MSNRCPGGGLHNWVRGAATRYVQTWHCTKCPATKREPK